jgi:hypothetical protein
MISLVVASCTIAGINPRSSNLTFWMKTSVMLDLFESASQAARYATTWKFPQTSFGVGTLTSVLGAASIETRS